MRHLLSTLLAALLACSAFAQSRESLYGRFEDAINERDTAAVLSLISEWETLFPGDAELYSVRANYYLQTVVKEVVIVSDVEPTDGREYGIVQDSLGVKGYMYYEKQLDQSRLDAAKKTLTEGVEAHPDRLDFRLGKVTLHILADENELAVDEVISALERSVKNKNKWFDTLDLPVETEGVSYLRNCIQEYFSQLLGVNDLGSAERMIDACLKMYPKDAIFLTNKGNVCYYAGDLEGAMKWFLKARKRAPEDMLIVMNIANLYGRKGDVKKAVKYYDMVVESGDEDFSEIAKSEIQELTEPAKQREVIPVDWKEIKAIVKENPDAVRELVSKLCAPKLDATITYKDRIIAFYGQSLLSNGVEQSLADEASKLLSQRRYADALAKAEEALTINPLNLVALDRAGTAMHMLIETGDTSFTRNDVIRYFDVAMRIYDTIAITGLGNEEYPFCVTSVADEYEFMRNYLEIYQIEQQALIGVCDVFTLSQTSEYYSDKELYFDATRPLERLEEVFRN